MHVYTLRFAQCRVRSKRVQAFAHTLRAVMHVYTLRFVQCRVRGKRVQAFPRTLCAVMHVYSAGRVARHLAAAVPHREQRPFFFRLGSHLPLDRNCSGIMPHFQCMLGHFVVFIIHRTLTRTTGSLTCVCDLFAYVYTLGTSVYSFIRRIFVRVYTELDSGEMSGRPQSLARNCHPSMW